MHRQGAQSRTGLRKREPLSDGSSRVNVTSTPPRSNKSRRSHYSPSSVAPGSIPHHESLVDHGSLIVRDAVASPIEEQLHSLSSKQGVQMDPQMCEGLEQDKRASQASTTSSQASHWSHPKKTVGSWQLGKDIGRGMVGKVRKVRHVYTGQLAAAKIIPKALAEQCRAESLMKLELATAAKKRSDPMRLPLGIEREVVIMKLLEHPNVVKLYDVWENKRELYLIMELVPDGELFDYVTAYEYLLEDEAIFIFRQVVAALLNAHRLGIYHRDLKPENILIHVVTDPDTELEYPHVKLADFGMAALQPKGKFLSTACGSMHYAAPEVFDKHYDGSKADVWSLGIILYVMLCGMLPFDDPGGDNKNSIWYRLIKSGNYRRPTHLSPEAQDLIAQMLVPHARRRISLEAVWNHPLLEKWSVAWGETKDQRDETLGPAPSLTSWSLRSERDIDQDIFHNLRVLWHSETEEALRKRLLSNERNFEKLFYASLMQHRDEHLENYVPEDFSVSASDYHHIHHNIEPDDLPPLPASAYTRTKSSLSILHDDVSQSKIGTRKSSPSQRSYDPYRSSRSALVDEGGNFNVTVHRQASGHTRQSSTNRTVKPHPSRVETLKKQQNRLSTGSSSAWLSTQASPSVRPTSRMSYRSMSRNSIVTSAYPSSPPASIVFRPSSSHKRGVDFSHVRRSSTLSALPTSPRKSGTTTKTGISGDSRPLNTPSKGKAKAVSTLATPQTTPKEMIEPPTLSASYMRDVKANMERARIRKSKTHSQVIDTEARKISVELEKFCEEAFNRESTGSSRKTNTTQAQSSYDTPPSSISNPGSTHSWQGPTSPEHGTGQRSEVSRDTPNSHIARGLAEARKMLSDWHANENNAYQELTYHQLMAQIEHLMQYQAQAMQYDSRRVVSAPEPTQGSLPMISEEEKATSEEKHTPQRPRHNLVPMSNYNIPINAQPAQSEPASATIRLVKPSPSIAPLNVVKTTSSANSPAKSHPSHVANYNEGPSQASCNRFDQQTQLASHRIGPPLAGSPLSPISEDAAAHAVAARHARSMTGKRQGWFGGWRSREDFAKDNTSARPFNVSSRPARQDTASTDLRTHDASVPTPRSSMKPSQSAQRPGFLAMFRKKRSKKSSPLQSHMAIVDDDSNQSQTALSQASSHSQRARGTSRIQGFYSHISATRSRIASSGSNEEERDLGIQRNWFARILHIKPASQAMCFRIPRGRVRQALVRLLRGWKTAGIDDVMFDRQKNLIFARVVSDNYLQIKEVAFVAQLFVVLEHGHHANLCVTRFIQRKGAASSFRVVVGKIEQAMKRDGYIVEDPVKKREMEEMLTG